MRRGVLDHRLDGRWALGGRLFGRRGGGFLAVVVVFFRVLVLVLVGGWWGLVGSRFDSFFPDGLVLVLVLLVACRKLYCWRGWCLTCRLGG